MVRRALLIIAACFSLVGASHAMACAELADLSSERPAPKRGNESLINQLAVADDPGPILREIDLKYKMLIIGRLTRQSMPVADAEEAWQETLVRLWKHRKNITELKCSDLTYIWRIANNRRLTATANYFKRQADFQKFLSQLSWTKAVTTPLQNALKNEEGRIVEFVMARTALDELQRISLEMFHSGKTIQEIADKTGAAVGTVKIKLFRGRKQLNEYARRLFPAHVSQTNKEDQTSDTP